MNTFVDKIMERLPGVGYMKDNEKVAYVKDLSFFAEKQSAEALTNIFEEFQRTEFTRRPQVAWFWKRKEDKRKEVQTFYVCKKKPNPHYLSKNSAGGCPSCGTFGGEPKTGEVPYGKNIIKCQSGCYDCTIYNKITDRTLVKGPGCEAFGYGFPSCNTIAECACSACCNFEYLRDYNPAKLKEEMAERLKALPPSKSTPGEMFRTGNASFTNINDFLKSKGVKK